MFPSKDFQFRYIPGVSSYLPAQKEKRNHRTITSFEGISFRGPAETRTVTSDAGHEPEATKTWQGQTVSSAAKNVNAPVHQKSAEKNFNLLKTFDDHKFNTQR